MSCRRTQLLIQSVVDGAATRAERETVDAHLAGCAECEQVMTESRRLVAMLSAGPERRVSDSFEANLAAALRHTAPAPQAAAWWERFRLRFEYRLRVPALVTAGSLAAAVVAAVVAPMIPGPSRSNPESGQYVASALQKHEVLERTRSRVEPDVVEASLQLNTGDFLTE